ncbi:MAG: 30S ribosomal protein S6 [Deltaproteobacteria bacterium]|jgi:small subunit ribosomal protein S6|nr:30S ribosomal protein S6 [Deltaproteobacteria bacterium]MBW2504215.1 30S ribosomal protein S6 [Deltaproteobacteria bacterium]
MRTYESIFIVHPEKVEDGLDAVIQKYKDVLSGQGATILKVDNWGTRTLAYPIMKQNQGNYVLVVFEAQSSVIAEYERRMRIDDSIIKFQTVLLEGGYEAPAEAPVDDASSEEVDAEISSTDSEEA